MHTFGDARAALASLGFAPKWVDCGGGYYMLATTLPGGVRLELSPLTVRDWDRVAAAPADEVDAGAFVASATGVDGTGLELGGWSGRADRAQWGTVSVRSFADIASLVTWIAEEHTA